MDHVVGVSHPVPTIMAETSLNNCYVKVKLAVRDRDSSPVGARQCIERRFVNYTSAT
jgi:hypothetical protein